MKNTVIKKRLFSLAIVAIFGLGSGSLYAQLPSFPGDVDDEAPSAPIDALIGITMLAGAVYGGKKLKANNKKDEK